MDGLATREFYFASRVRMSRRWWKCAEWEVAADVHEEQTFFSFSTWLLSFTAIPCEHDENNLLPVVWLNAIAREMPVVQAVFQVSLQQEKSPWASDRLTFTFRLMLLIPAYIFVTLLEVMYRVNL